MAARAVARSSMSPAMAASRSPRLRRIDDGCTVTNTCGGAARVGACPETASNSGDLVGRLSMVRNDDLRVFNTKENDMPRFEDSIDVALPVRVAYDQWTQFEQFPQFMEGVDRVVQVDDKQLEWTATVAGREKHWRAEITDQTPDTRIAWKSTSGAENAGAVLFKPLGPDHTRITLKLDADPEGPVESAGAGLGFLERRVKGDLERFRDYVETTGPTGKGWRGEIHGDVVRSDDGA